MTEGPSTESIMAMRTVLIHDRCTTPECGKVLHSIAEGMRGTCGTCWFKTLRPDTKKAMNTLIAAAFRPTTDAEKGEAVGDAVRKLRDDPAGKPTTEGA